MTTTTDFEFLTTDGEFEAVVGLTGRPAPSSPVLLMEHLGSLAAQAESEAEAEAFLGALVPLATRLLPGIARATPQLVRGVAQVGRQLWRNPRTRRLVAAVPQVVQRTAADLARQYSRGTPLSGQATARTLARNAATVLDDPGRRRQAIRRCRALDRRWHVTHPAPGGGPTGGPVGAPRGAAPRPCTCR